MLGERYGYGVFRERSGYNYITGGGGYVVEWFTSCPILKYHQLILH